MGPPTRAGRAQPWLCPERPSLGEAGWRGLLHAATDAAADVAGLESLSGCIFAGLADGTTDANRAAAHRDVTSTISSPAWISVWTPLSLGRKHEGCRQNGQQVPSHSRNDSQQHLTTSSSSLSTRHVTASDLTSSQFRNQAKDLKPHHKLPNTSCHAKKFLTAAPDHELPYLAG